MFHMSFQSFQDADEHMMEGAEEADDESQNSDCEKTESPTTNARMSSRQDTTKSNSDNTRETLLKDTFYSDTQSPNRRSLRARRASIDYSRGGEVTENDNRNQAPESGEDEEDTPIRTKSKASNEDHGWVRRSSRRVPEKQDGANAVEEESDAGISEDERKNPKKGGVRRSTRQHHKPSFYDPEEYKNHRTTSEEEESSEEEEKGNMSEMTGYILELGSYLSRFPPVIMY